jgi:tRNA-uridine 2-sulfurtransferase
MATAYRLQPSASPPTVLVGMSGGVDSSVTAALLVKQGYRVIGGFIKNWSDSKELWTGECAWRGERRDALRVAAKLGIPLLTFDFEKEYKERVVGELFRGYEAGETPNPDVLCNEAIKFGLFFDEAVKMGADFVATGHYARVEHLADGSARLLRGLDPDKDQSYFLYRVPQNVLRRTLFPIGEFRKPHVREIAAEFNLPVAEKPDSQGICFIGKLDMEEFLRKKIPSKPGKIVDEKGDILGEHQGLDAYTIGQRQGIKVSKGEEPWYVADKNLETNELIVVQGAEHPRLFREKAVLRDLHWTHGEAPSASFECEVQVRYRQEPVMALAENVGPDSLQLNFRQAVKAVAPGQSAVLYQGDECLGGGVITE